MKIKIYNNHGSDSIIIESDTLEEIKEICKERIKLPSWSNGWSEVLEK